MKSEDLSKFEGVWSAKSCISHLLSLWLMLINMWMIMWMNKITKPMTTMIILATHFVKRDCNILAVFEFCSKLPHCHLNIIEDKNKFLIKTRARLKKP